MKFLRVFLIAAAALGFARDFASAQSNDFPNHPIKLVVGFGAGGSTDVAARIMAQKMGEILGQTILVENRPGASGLLAAEDVIKSPPDGYTLMMASQTVLAVAPKLTRKATIDPVKDFAPVVYCGASPLVLVVNPSFPAHTTAEMIAMAKAEPGKIIFGTGGVGTTPHIASEMFQFEAGIKMSHVPYRGEAGAINDLVAGQIPAMFANLSAVGGPACRRHGTRSRRHQSATRAIGAEHPDDRRDIAGLCRRHLVRHRRAEGHATSCHRQAQCRGTKGAGAGRHQKALRRCRHDHHRRRRP